MSGQGLSEGIRLAKRVAALRGCSRSQAEALIAAGAVQVDGQVVTDPARRVTEAASVQVLPAAAGSLGPLTLLAHLPIDEPTAHRPADPMQVLAHLQPMASLELPPVHRRALLQHVWPLASDQCGLAVWTDDPAVLRRLLDRQLPIEQEWRLSTARPLSAHQLADLAAQGWRVSLAQQAPDRAGYRMVSKQSVPPPAHFEGVLELRRLRLPHRPGPAAAGPSPRDPRPRTVLRPPSDRPPGQCPLEKCADSPHLRACL